MFVRASGVAGLCRGAGVVQPLNPNYNVGAFQFPNLLKANLHHVISAPNPTKPVWGPKSQSQSKSVSGPVLWSPQYSVYINIDIDACAHKGRLLSKQ